MLFICDNSILWTLLNTFTKTIAMKRKNILILILILCCGNIMAGNRLADKGYAGSINISATPQLGLGVDITTSHGYSFGNGLWMGGGFGVSLASEFDGAYIPVFTEAKYTFMKDQKVSPFIDCRFGVVTELERFYTLFAPSAGVDINHISIFTLYNMWSDIRTFNLGIAYSF